MEENPWEWRAGVADRMPVDEAWEVPLRPRREGAELGRGRAASVDDHEHETVRVQLQTFSSPPAPPSPPRTTIDLPPLTPVPVVAEQEVEPPLPPTTRYISNPRHLLMISLELAMMRADKIRSPLRPRAVVCRCGGSRGAQMPGSGLRWEVRVV